MGWFKYLSIFVITAIFTLSLLFFMTNVQNANNSPQNILDSPQLTSIKTSSSSFITKFNTTSQEQYNASATEQQTSPPTGALLVYSIFTSLGRFLTLPISLITALFLALSEIIGIDSSILAGISALILLAGVLRWYRLVKIGE